MVLEPPPSPTPTSTPAIAILAPTFGATPLPTADQAVANVGQPDRTAVELVGKIEAQPILITGVVTTSGSVELVGKIKERTIRLRAPGGLALDREGNLYIVDGGNQRILKYGRDGQFVLQWGSYGAGNGQFIIPEIENYKSGAIAIDEQENVYVADTGNARVQKFDRSGKFLLKWGGTGNGPGQLRRPLGVAVDSQGNVYVVDDRPKSRVEKFDHNGKFLRQWGTRGSTDPFYAASAIVIDRQDFVYVTNLGSGSLQIFDHDGGIIANWSLNCGDERYVAPLGVTLDSKGNSYVTDSVANRICKFGSNGRFLTQWDSLGADGTQFSRPYGIAVDAQGNIYVADSNNDRVLKFRQP